MDIRFYDTAEKLGESRPQVESLLDCGDEPWFWVIHPAGYTDAGSFCEDKNDVVNTCIDRGGGVLFLSGSAYAGSRVIAEKLKLKYSGRIHCLSIAVDSPESSPKVVGRIRNFLRLVESLQPGDRIPWEEAEPTEWPQNLVAIYLVVKAMAFSPEDAPAIRKAWEDMDLKWRGRLCSDAQNEFIERGFDVDEWAEAGLPSSSTSYKLPDSDLVATAAEVLRLSLVGF